MYISLCIQYYNLIFQNWLKISKYDFDMQIGFIVSKALII